MFERPARRVFTFLYNLSAKGVYFTSKKKVIQTRKNYVVFYAKIVYLIIVKHF